MNKFAIVIPCVISGMLLGVMTPTHATPQLPPNGNVQPQMQARTNIINVIRFDNSTQDVYGCFPGADLLDCIDAPTTFDSDTTFKLLSGAGSLSCGVTPMTVGSTCLYSQAVYGDSCDLRCGSVRIAADQTYVDPTQM